jgi:hypothetical protein
MVGEVQALWIRRRGEDTIEKILLPGKRTQEDELNRGCTVE